MSVPLRPNQRWSLDFLSGTFGACRKFRILAVNDDCCRENLALIVDTSISGAGVARELDALVRIYGKPAYVVSDNGTEFASKAILKWANDNGVEWHCIDPFVAKTVHWTVFLTSEPTAERVHRKLQRQPAG